jgi:dephospho-CoA kinase
VLTVAVTGGIGSGKSTVSALLADLGAVVVDSDRLARQVVAPDTPGLVAVADAFGPAVLAADGSLDRAALAAIVFHDADARHRLEAITHPLVRAAFRAARDAAGPAAIVVNDIPLIRTVADAAQFHLVITVAAPDEVRMRRLLGRGLAEPDARARMRAQLSDDERRALSDVWLDNGGDEVGLRRAVEALWTDRLVPFQQNLLAGRPAGSTAAARTGPAADGSAPASLLCARVSAATGGLPCEPDADAGTGLVVRVPDLATAEVVAPALARAGFPRRDGGDEAGVPGPDPVERIHAGADPGRPVTVHLTVTSPSA